MTRRPKYESEPERSVVDLSETEAVSEQRITKGYWDSAVRHLFLLSPGQALKFMFHNGHVPSGIRSSIRSAAVRAGLRVSVKVNGSVVYLWKVGTRPSIASSSSRPPIHCEVCGKPISRLPGTSKQFVCSGGEERKSECQKVWRYAREHGVTVEEAKQRCGIPRTSERNR